MIETTYFVLALGAILSLCGHALGGRIAGLSVTALWSAGTAYFVMEPLNSFQVSSPRDLAALALYGMLGIVLAKPAQAARQRLRNKPAAPAFRPPCKPVDFKTLLADLTSSSELSRCLDQRHIEIEASRLGAFRCSQDDAIGALSHLLTDALNDPQVCRITLYSGDRPGVAMLFADAHRLWPMPLYTPIVIGTGATSFDNGYSRMYQISVPAASQRKARE
jgi:hypothetical protein